MSTPVGRTLQPHAVAHVIMRAEARQLVLGYLMMSSRKLAVGFGTSISIRKGMAGSASVGMGKRERISLRMRLRSVLSRPDYNWTIFAETGPASIRPILSQSRLGKTRCEGKVLRPFTPEKPIASGDTSSISRTRIPTGTVGGFAGRVVASGKEECAPSRIEDAQRQQDMFIDGVAA